jgi:hypothetical protein
MQVSTIGFDLAKNVFQVHGIDANEKVVVRKQLRRGQVMAFFEGCPLGALSHDQDPNLPFDAAARRSAGPSKAHAGSAICCPRAYVSSAIDWIPVLGLRDISAAK